MLCGEKPAVIFTALLLLAAANPVTWESTVRLTDRYRLLGSYRVDLLANRARADYEALWLARGAVGMSKKCSALPRGQFSIALQLILDET